MGNLGSKKDDKPEARYCVPSGLYPHLDWDLKVVKKLILEKKLAPMYPPKEDKSGATELELEECPICFLYYPGGLNRSKCCKQSICTECYLQVKKPGVNTPSHCPFCNAARYTVIFRGPLTKEEREAELKEQQKVEELKIQMMKEEKEQDAKREQERRLSQAQNPTSSPVTTPPPAAGASASVPSPAVTVTFPSPSSPSPASPVASPPSRSDSFSRPSSRSTVSRSAAVSGALPDFVYNNREGLTDLELEELMLMEAIRLSLQSSAEQSKPASSSADDHHGNDSESDGEASRVTRREVQPVALFRDGEHPSSPSFTVTASASIEPSASSVVPESPLVTNHHANDHKESDLYTRSTSDGRTQDFSTDDLARAISMSLQNASQGY